MNDGYIDLLNEETKDFIEVLYHDDRNSNYFALNKNSNWPKQTNFSLKDKNLIQTLSGNNFISINGFVGSYRTLIKCRQINCIFFDLDYHTEIIDKHSKYKKENTFQIILDEVKNKFPEPNLIIDSGRGLHLYYIFEKSIPYKLGKDQINSKGLTCLNFIRNQLEDKIIKLLSSYKNTLSLDTMVFDISRLARIPGTYNSESQSYSLILSKNTDYYEFKDFNIPKWKNKVSTKRLKSSKTKIIDGRLNVNLLNTRKEEMIKLQRSRNYDCEGYRDFMIFLYYNSAVQISSKKSAQNLTTVFNDNFTHPLSKTELAEIFKGIDKNKTKEYKGHYKITKNWIKEKLQITEKEINDLDLFKFQSSKRKEIVLQNQKKKQDRNQIIISLFKNGKNHKEIAKSVSVSLRTVQNVLKENKFTRNYNVQKNAT